jgi:hypothetical protein
MLPLPLARRPIPGLFVHVYDVALPANVTAVVDVLLHTTWSVDHRQLVSGSL